jgi:hypothetical protein
MRGTGSLGENFKIEQKLKMAVGETRECGATDR